MLSSAGLRLVVAPSLDFNSLVVRLIRAVYEQGELRWRNVGRIHLVRLQHLLMPPLRSDHALPTNIGKRD
jgi:hypothetical protein